MVIDNTRFSAFLRNQEFYRLRYCQNLAVPKANVSYGLQRGTAFHLIADEAHKGTKASEIDAVVAAEVADPTARSKAKVMHKVFAAKYHASAAVTKLASEVEFRAPIAGTAHEIAGRIDEILNYRGALWCGETKTANARADYAKLKYEWSRNTQANFEIAGALSLGYKVEGVLVRTVTEHSPPRIWEIEVARTDEEMRVWYLNVAMVCDAIELYKARYGIDTPWPHSNSAYPCSMEGRCEFEDVCQKLALRREGFETRKEHLPILLK